MTHSPDDLSLLVLTCVHDRIGPFTDMLLPWLTDDPSSEWFTEKAPLELSRIYAIRPPRGGSEPLHMVMWTPRTMPTWTACFVNSEDGRGHLFAKLAQSGAPEMVSIRSSSPTERWGVQEFIYRQAQSAQYEPTRLLQWLQEDDGYRLVATGAPLPPEGPASERTNPIPTRAGLLSFLRRFGIDLENEQFWESDSDAIYLSQRWLSNSDD